MGLISATVGLATAQLSAQPGERIVAVFWSRGGSQSASVTPDAGGAVWQQVVAEATVPQNQNARRSLAVFTLDPASTITDVTFTASWAGDSTGGIWMVMQEGGYELAGTAVADSGTGSANQLSTGSVASIPAGDWLAVAALASRDGDTGNVVWATTDVQPDLVGGGSVLLDVFGGAGTGGGNAGAAGYLTLVGQPGGSLSDQVTLPGGLTRQITVALAVWTLADTGITGTLAVTEQDDTLAASGTVAPPPVSGSLSAVEADDQLAAAGTHTSPAFTGSLAATEGDDVLAASGTVTSAGVSGSLAATEAGDILDAAGITTAPSFTGNLAAVEAPDTLAAAGTVTSESVAGSLAATEEPDTLAATGTFMPATIGGMLSVTEQPDTLAAAGIHIPPVTGTLATVEAADVLVAAGVVDNSGVVAPAPAERTLTVAVESRMLQVPAEVRRLAVPAESRTLVAS